jgi:hypothetical protein
MQGLLNFDDMLTPKIITIVYWIALVGVVLSGLFTIFGGAGNFLMNLLMGLLIIVFGGLLVRIYCELMIVLFKINENIKRLADR